MTILNINNQTIKALLDASSDRAALLSLDFTILAVNKAVCKYLGLTSDRIVGRSIYELLPPNRAQHRNRMMEMVLEAGMPVQFVEERDGETLLNRIHPIKNDQGEMCQLIVFVKDMTEENRLGKLLQEENKRQKDDVEQLSVVNDALRAIIAIINKKKEGNPSRAQAILQEVIIPLIDKIVTTETEGKRAVNADIVKSILQRSFSGAMGHRNFIRANLTRSEIEVADLILASKSNKEIAELLNVSITTIAFHRRNIRKKMGLTNSKVNLASYLRGEQSHGQSGGEA